MPLAGETPLFWSGGRVTLTALKWSGASVTVGSLVPATTVRVTAGEVGVVCAVPEAGNTIAPSNSSPVVLNCMIASSPVTGRSQSTPTRRLTRSARLPFADRCARGGYIAACAEGVLHRLAKRPEVDLSWRRPAPREPYTAAGLR